MIESSTYIELKQLVHGGRAVAFVGSGLSSHVYDSWTSLICNLCQECDVQLPPKTKRNDALFMMKRADKCRIDRPDQYRAYLKDHFSPEPVYRRKAYELLAAIPFRGYVTTNFDPMLEDELRRRHDNLHVTAYKNLSIQHLASEKSVSLFYLHGRIDPDIPISIDRLVLGLDEFEAAYARKEIVGPVAGFLQQLFTYERVVFFGYGLTEPLMKQVIQKCSDIRADIGTEGKHFAFLPHTWREEAFGPVEIDVRLEAAEDTQLEKCGIEVIRYEAKDRFHSTMEAILQDLLSPRTNGLVREKEEGRGGEYLT